MSPTSLAIFSHRCRHCDMLLFPLLMDLNIIVAALYSVPKMPCCLESLGVQACTRLRQHNPVKFYTRCTTEADFAILQCCHTCETNVAEFGRTVFTNDTESTQCFDRSICSPNSCSSTVIAFRTCRKSCGYCNPSIYASPNTHTECPFVG